MSASPAQLQPGTVLSGAYRILRPLSQGGMGAVYVAEQLATKKERAVKVMRPELTQSAKMRERFIQEAQIGAKIESEHVIEVIDAGVDLETSTPWLAMELLKGRTLTEHVREHGPLDARETREIFAQLCHAVGAAHDVGIVHRDLKPDNVFLADSRREGGAFTVKVLDFGIAKLMSEAATHATGAIGTPLFMPPEQMVPGVVITPAADVWALGLIAFYVLSGRTYWRSGNVESSSAMMVMNEVNNLPITPPTARVVELGLDVALPTGFDDWFLKCVSRVVDYRYPNARDLRAGLLPVLDQERSPAAEGPTRKSSPRRHPVEAGSLTVAAEPLGPSGPTEPPATAGLEHADTVLGAARTTGAALRPPRRKPRLALAAVVVAALGLFTFLRARPSPPRVAPASSAPVPEALAAASAPSAAVSVAVASRSPSKDLDALESIVRVADLDLQAAHDQLAGLPPGSAALGDPRAMEVVDRWVEHIFGRAATDGGIPARRHLLTKVINDGLVGTKKREQAFDRLSALEPRNASDKTRHFIAIERPSGAAAAQADADLFPYARVAVVTELARREDVIVGASASTAYEIDRVVEEHKLRAVILTLDISARYEPHLTVKVTGTYFDYANRTLLGTFSSEAALREVTTKASAPERDLTLLASQRVAALLAKAQTPRDPKRPLDPKQPPEKLKLKAPCSCPPGDPLCDCL